MLGLHLVLMTLHGWFTISNERDKFYGVWLVVVVAIKAYI